MLVAQLVLTLAVTGSKCHKGDELPRKGRTVAVCVEVFFISLFFFGTMYEVYVCVVRCCQQTSQAAVAGTAAKLSTDSGKSAYKPTGV